jgi:hypothetical protein
MSSPLISIVITQLASIIEQQIRQEVKLVRSVRKETEKLENTLKAIEAVLIDADKRQIKEEGVKIWVERLKDVAYDTNDFFNDWNTEIVRLQITGNPSIGFRKHLPCFSLNRLRLRREIALKVKYINCELVDINTERERYNFQQISSTDEANSRVKSTSFIDDSETLGRKDDKDTIVRKLLSVSGPRVRGFEIISIVGMGGIGKTTLAQDAYNSHEILENNFDVKIWVCVSDPYDELRVAKAIVEDVKGSAPVCHELNTALKHVHELILNKKFLLVLDDVWTEDSEKWKGLFDCLKLAGAFGSKILVTTRNEKVSTLMRASFKLQLGFLSDQACWGIFSHMAFFERSKEECEQLKEIGRKISDKCKGLPLAAKTIGSLMRFRKSQDWQSVLDSEIWGFDDPEKGLLAPLLLSYYDLPPPVKQCFLYCANFPQDYKIEPDRLIKIWMAQGYLTPKSGSSKSQEMEIVGKDYLDNLVMRSFFQASRNRKDARSITRYTMHDMVHDFAQRLAENECAIIEADASINQKMAACNKRVRHLTLVRGEDSPFPVPANNTAVDTRKLHSLWVQAFYDSPLIVSQSEIDVVPDELFNRLRCIKVLDWSRNRLHKLPQEVENLTNLRYLNLSHNPLQELPETVCNLCNLQTLKLSGCEHIWKLPKGMEKLVNLRHLEIDQTKALKVLPKGIGKLTSLRTLSKFCIGESEGEEETCKLGDLEHLNLLEGCLKLEALGRVRDPNDAKKASLKNMKNIHTVEMDFSPTVGASEETLAAFELHVNMQSLQIKQYGGTSFPNSLVSSDFLKKLRLQDCKNCTFLPPLGKLTALETLEIESMDSLLSIGNEFMGIETDKSTAAFPKLKKLTMAKMNNLEEWNIIGDMHDKIMPSLKYVKISNCEKLTKLPDLLLQMAPLRNLRIQNCQILHQNYNKETGEERHKLSRILKSRVYNTHI